MTTFSPNVSLSIPISSNNATSAATTSTPTTSTTTAAAATSTTATPTTFTTIIKLTTTTSTTTLFKVRAHGYYVNGAVQTGSVLGGVIGNRQHALKPMCIMCATKYGNSAGGIYAPRRVCVPLDDPPIPLYLVQKDELLIPAKHNTSRDEKENEATRLRGGRKDGDINLLEELQVAQQLGGYESGDPKCADHSCTQGGAVVVGFTPF